MRPYAIALALAALPAAAGAADWVGIWTASPSWCQYSDRSGSHTPAPIAITETEVIGYENTCAILSTQQLGETPAWRQVIRCTSEGSTFEEERMLVADGPNVLWISSGGLEPIQFYRCAEPGQ